MFRANSYIAFHDLSPKANFLWLSPSITNVLGYNPEELVGTCPYDIIWREDITMTESVHREVAMDDLVAGQVSLRARAKNGSCVAVNLIINFCYDMGVTCGTLLDPNPSDYVQFGAQPIAMGNTL
ncbi:hypothetical protein BGX26_012136, partial [Mortierella sp. AD094]